MGDTLLVLPHQLFDTVYFDKGIYRCLVWEHPHYFTKYRYNKKKLVLHRASMKAYADYLTKRSFEVRYLRFDERPPPSDYLIFDPVDRIELPNGCVVVETPNFLLTKADYADYRRKTKHFFFHAFYRWGRQKLAILEGVQSQDRYNRKKIPSSLALPSHGSFVGSCGDVVREAQRYTEDHFPNNPGSVEDFTYPVSYGGAKKALAGFIDERFEWFGDYQDSIHRSESRLFHSVLSSSMNVGLVNPREVVEVVRPLQTKLNAYEGYIRQLFWREYQRYCYIYYNFNRKNYFQNTKRLSKKWYEGRVGILPVDTCIVRGFQTGYLNHIERLMVIGNCMMLSGLHPKEGFKWFMEMSCDSYEWVMTQNVLDMVFCVSGGVTMRRPYISSSNYILKMSNYPKGEWCDRFDRLYRTFKSTKHAQLHKFRYYYR